MEGNGNGLKVDLGEMFAVVSSSVSKSNVGPCGFCSLRVKANTVLCVQCGMWIHSRYAIVKTVTPKFSRNFTCR